jgi:serine-type D-Ala-D-Ala carboxypeptidase
MMLRAEYQAPGFPAVSSVLLQFLPGGFPPGAAMSVLGSSGVRYEAAGGWAVLGGLDGGPTLPVACAADTLFDLASLTKVVGTLPLVLLLHQRGQWSIDDPIGRWLPGAPASPVTISDCLLHTSGLVPHRPFYETCKSPEEIKRTVIGELASARPGREVAYSDLGFMLLGWALEECAGWRLEVLVQREVLEPLGMTETGYRPRLPRDRIAATEADGDQRRGPGLVWGQVHDGNAFALGGVSGHAGLFGPAADLARYAASWLGVHPLLSPATVALVTSRRAGAGETARALGWRTHPEVLGDWPEGTLWHTGFTGTSLLIAPALDTAVVLLSNAVHPVRRLAETMAFRGDVHRAARAVI